MFQEKIISLSSIQLNLDILVNLKKKVFFWISNNNKKLFNKTLDNVYNCRPDKWLRIYKSNKKKIMEYDPGNKKLKNLISSITND